MSGFNIAYSAGGDLDKIGKIEKIEEIKNFANFSVPYNKMIFEDIPAIASASSEVGVAPLPYVIEYETPDEEVEFLSFTVTATGYAIDDYYDMFVNDVQWFDTWYLSEVKEGLFLGTSTYVAKLPPKSRIKIMFYNTGTSKRLYIGFRMLKQKEVAAT